MSTLDYSTIYGWDFNKTCGWLWSIVIDWIKWRGFKARGTQTGPIAALQANFVLNSTQFCFSILAIKLPQFPSIYILMTISFIQYQQVGRMSLLSLHIEVSLKSVPSLNMASKFLRPQIIQFDCHWQWNSSFYCYDQFLFSLSAGWNNVTLRSHSNPFSVWIWHWSFTGGKWSSLIAIPSPTFLINSRFAEFHTKEFECHSQLHPSASMQYIWVLFRSKISLDGEVQPETIHIEVFFLSQYISP